MSTTAHGGLMMGSKLRTLKHSRLYDDLYQSLLSDHPDMADAVDGLTLYIAENPYKFLELWYGYYIAKSVGSSRLPAVRILYLIEDDDHVILCAISEESPDEAF